MAADNPPKTKEEVQYTPAPAMRDLDSAAGAFSSLRNGITPSSVGTAVCCAPPGRLWTQVYFQGIFTTLTVSAHLGEGVVPLPDVTVARLIASATGAAENGGTAGAWCQHGMDWLKASFPEKTLNPAWLSYMHQAWTNEDWILAFLRHDPASFRSTLKPVVIVHRHKDRTGPRCAVVMLPLPVAADLALLYARLGRNTANRAPIPPKTGNLEEDRARAAKLDGRPIMKQWAAFGESVPSFPLLFSCLHPVDEPGWEKMEAQLAWLRYTGKEWPTEAEIRRRASAQGIPLPNINRHWGAIFGVAGPSFTLGFAVPRRLSIQISQWFMPNEYTEQKFLELASRTAFELEGTPCPLIPYLLAHAEADNEGAHQVLLRVLARTDPSIERSPWVPAPSRDLRLLPPALNKKTLSDASRGRASGHRRPASGSMGMPASKRRQPSPASSGQHGWRPSVRRS